MAFREHQKNKEKKKAAALSPKEKKLSKEEKRNNQPTVPAVPPDFKPSVATDLHVDKP
jgi:hypothetical protein